MNANGVDLPKSVHVVSLGCPKNLVDSEVMLGHLRKAGVEMTDAIDRADVIIVNTCAFIHSAKRESVDAILDVARYKQAGSCRALIVSGCLAQRYRSDIAKELPEVDAFLGPDECGKIDTIVKDVWTRMTQSRSYPLLPEQPFHEIRGHVPNSKSNSEHVPVFRERQYIAPTGRPGYLYDHEAPRVVLTPRHYAYVKISEGCDNPCKFCIIPRLRGPFRSRPIESIVAEVKKLVAGGVVEVVLIAQDLTDYGVDIYKARRLGALLERLNDVEGLKWIRLLYAYPAHVTEDFIDALANVPKVCRYLDMPIQYLNDKLLLGMGRRFGKQQTKELIAHLREKVPGLGLRTSLIVGSPGETQEMFEEMLEEMQSLQFERLGVFTYSKEEGTAAFYMKGQVPEKLKQQRRAVAMACQQKISLQINRRKVGQDLEVLVDGEAKDKKECYVGRTQWDAPGIDNTVLIRGVGLRPGEIVQVNITKATAYDLEGICATHATAQSAQPAYSA